MWAEDKGIDLLFLIHDHDTKFAEGFNEHFKRSRGGPKSFSGTRTYRAGAAE